MKIPRIKGSTFILSFPLTIIAMNYTPSTLPWVIGVFTVQMVWVGLGAYSYLTEDPKVKAEREKELAEKKRADQVAHIRELEKGLGFTPLELGEIEETETEKRKT